MQAGYQRCIADSEVTALSSLAHPSSVEGAELERENEEGKNFMDDSPTFSKFFSQVCPLLCASSHRVFKNE